MKRRNFFKALVGAAAGTAVVAALPKDDKIVGKVTQPHQHPRGLLLEVDHRITDPNAWYLTADSKLVVPPELEFKAREILTPPPGQDDWPTVGKTYTPLTHQQRASLLRRLRSLL